MQKCHPDDFNSIKYIMKMLHPDDVKRFEYNFHKLLEKEGKTQETYLIKNDSGIFRNMELSAISVCDGSPKPKKMYGMARLKNEANTEIATENSKNNHKLAALAKATKSKVEDYITGMMSYSSFLTKADKILKNRSEDDHYAVVCADINEF